MAVLLLQLVANRPRNSRRKTSRGSTEGLGGLGHLRPQLTRRECVAEDQRLPRLEPAALARDKGGSPKATNRYWKAVGEQTQALLSQIPLNQLHPQDSRSDSGRSWNAPQYIGNHHFKRKTAKMAKLPSASSLCIDPLSRPWCGCSLPEGQGQLRQFKSFKTSHRS